MHVSSKFFSPFFLVHREHELVHREHEFFKPTLFKSSLLTSRKISPCQKSLWLIGSENLPKEDSFGQDLEKIFVSLTGASEDATTVIQVLPKCHLWVLFQAKVHDIFIPIIFSKC